MFPAQDRGGVPKFALTVQFPTSSYLLLNRNNPEDIEAQKAIGNIQQFEMNTCLQAFSSIVAHGEKNIIDPLFQPKK